MGSAVLQVRVDLLVVLVHKDPGWGGVTGNVTHDSWLHGASGCLLWLRAGGVQLLPCSMSVSAMLRRPGGALHGLSWGLAAVGVACDAQAMSPAGLAALASSCGGCISGPHCCVL